MNCADLQVLSYQGESEHKKSKLYFNRTNKVGVTEGLAHIDQVTSTLRRIRARVDNASGDNQRQTRARDLEEELEDHSATFKDTYKSPYYIPKQGECIRVGDWLRRHEEDPAIKVSLVILCTIWNSRELTYNRISIMISLIIWFVNLKVSKTLT